MKYIFLIIISLSQLAMQAQTVDFTDEKEVVHTNSSIEKTESGYKISLKLNIDSLWIVYDSIVGEGPIPFTIQYETLENFQVDSIVKPSFHKKFDELFEAEIYYLTGISTYAIYLKKIDAKKESKLVGTYEFMSCNLSSGICLPPVNNSFDFKVK